MRGLWRWVRCCLCVGALILGAGFVLVGCANQARPNGSDGISREASERWETGISYYTEDEEEIAGIVACLLEDEKTMELNSKGFDGDTQPLVEWLTTDTHNCSIHYGIPTGVEVEEACWYIKAVDAGSWWPVVLPEHMVEPVLERCYALEESFADTVGAAGSIHFRAVSPPSAAVPEIVDGDLVERAKGILLGNPDDDKTPEIGTAAYENEVTLYYGAGRRIRLFSYADQEMAQALTAVAWEQYQRIAEGSAV